MVTQFAIAAFALSAILWLPATSALAGPGEIDSSFATQGIGAIPVGYHSGGLAVLADLDGSSIVAGDADGDFFLARFRPDGTLDPTFGTNGIARVDLGGYDQPHGLARDAAGRIVLAGHSERAGSIWEVAVVRFLANGELDVDFGNSGKMTFAVPGRTNAIANSVALDDIGRLIVAGGAWNPDGPHTDALLAALTDTGDLDTTFGDAGTKLVDYATTGTNTAVSDYTSVMVAGGRIIVSGRGTTLAAHLLTGVFDPSFGIGGIADTTSLPWRGDSARIALQPDGMILVAFETCNRDALGECHVSSLDFSVARFSSAGVLDTSFARSGLAVVNVRDGLDVPVGIAVDALGRIYVGGRSSSTTVALALSIARLLPNGTLDQTFGARGVVFDLLGRSQAAAYGMSIDGAGRVLVTGSFGSNPSIALVARYEGGGPCDHEADGVACEDGDPCSAMGSCSAGLCQPGLLTPSLCIPHLACYVSKLSMGATSPGSIAVRLENAHEDVSGKVDRVSSVCFAASLDGSAPVGSAVTRVGYRLERLRPVSRRLLPVEVTDEFGSWSVEMRDAATGLFQPANLTRNGETPEGPGFGEADSYACYDVRQARRTKRRLSFVTPEFGGSEMLATGPVQLCVASSVRRERIFNGDAAFTCYKAQFAPGAPRHGRITDEIRTADALATLRLDTKRLGSFCFPAIASGVTP